MVQHVKHHGILQKLAAICLLILFMPSIVIGGQLAIIELQHRTANDIIPILLPLLQPDDTISGNGYQLFVTAPPESLQRLRTIITELDRAAKQLAITVVQGEHAIDTLNRLAISGDVSIGDKAAIRFGDPRRQPPDSVERC